MAMGCSSISTGTEYLIIASRPRFAKINDTALNVIAHALYDGPLPNSALKVSAQPVMSPTAVLRQASVTVAARTISPVFPR